MVGKVGGRVFSKTGNGVRSFGYVVVVGMMMALLYGCGVKEEVVVAEAEVETVQEERFTPEETYDLFYIDYANGVRPLLMDLDTMMKDAFKGDGASIADPLWIDQAQEKLDELGEWNEKVMFYTEVPDSRRAHYNYWYAAVSSLNNFIDRYEKAIDTADVFYFREALHEMGLANANIYSMMEEQEKYSANE